MARWQGSWLTRLGSAEVDGEQAGQWRGRRLGLPQDGPGALAGLGPRAAAFVVDILVAGLMGGLVNLVVAAPTDVQRNIAGYVAFALLYVVSLALTAQTPGMRLCGLRVLPLTGTRPALGLLPALLRTAILAAFIPALISDRDGRGLHDRAARTVVVRA